MLLEVDRIDFDVASVDDPRFLPGIRRLGATQSLLPLMAPAHFTILAEQEIRADVLACLSRADGTSTLRVVRDGKRDLAIGRFRAGER